MHVRKHGIIAGLPRSGDRSKPLYLHLEHVFTQLASPLLSTYLCTFSLFPQLTPHLLFFTVLCWSAFVWGTNHTSTWSSSLPFFQSLSLELTSWPMACCTYLAINLHTFLNGSVFFIFVSVSTRCAKCSRQARSSRLWQRLCRDKVDAAKERWRLSHQEISHRAEAKEWRLAKGMHAMRCTWMSTLALGFLSYAVYIQFCYCPYVSGHLHLWWVVFYCFIMAEYLL